MLSPAQLHNISTYIDILVRWNARVNLTGIRNEEEIVTRHFGESLFAARCLFPDASRRGQTETKSSEFSAVRDFDVDLASDQRPTTYDRVADVGSGAGFPGIPIKLWAPHISLTLIESNHKKATFLREAARALTLTDINIQNARAETLAPARFDVVTLRAVERFADALPVAARLLTPAGRLALLVSSSQLEKAHTALPDFTWSTPLPIPASASRVLLIGQRVFHVYKQVEQTDAESSNM